MSSRLAPSLAFASLLGLAACGHAAAFMPTQITYTGTNLARVDLTRVDGDILTLRIYNAAPETLVIDRDGFALQTPGGIVRREPGGLATFYNVPSGGSHEVRLRFRVERVGAGAPLYLLVDQAVRVNGQPLGLAPITLAATR